MFCGNCGRQLDDNAKFCTACGAKVQVIPAAEPAVEKTPVEEKKPLTVHRVEEKPVTAPPAEDMPIAAPRMEEKSVAAPPAEEKPVAAAPAEEKPAPKHRKTPKQRKLRRLGILQVLLAILAVVAVVAAVLLIVFSDKESEQQDDSSAAQEQVDEAQTEAPVEEAPVEEAPTEEEAPVEEVLQTEPVDLKSQLYGTWGVYYGEILQTISIYEDGTMYIWDGANGQWLEYSWDGDSTICYENLRYVCVDGQLVLIQDGQQTGYVYQRCPTLAGNPITGAASYEELYKMLTEEYMFTAEHVRCMPNISRGGVCSEILWFKKGISRQEASMDFLKMISLPEEDLARQMNEYYFEQGDISPIKFVITDLIPRDDMIKECQESLEDFDIETSELHDQYIWELAQAEMCWVVSGKVVYATGDSMPLSTDTETEGPLYIFLIGGRYYWIWSELGL